MSVTIPENKIPVSTHEKEVFSSSTRELSHLPPCHRDEADHRVMCLMFVTDATQGQTRIMIPAVDIDVAVHAVVVRPVLSLHLQVVCSS